MTKEPHTCVVVVFLCLWLADFCSPGRPLFYASNDKDPAGLICPPLSAKAKGICVQRCDMDDPEACPRGQVCCSNGCGAVCKAGVPARSQKGSSWCHQEENPVIADGGVGGPCNKVCPCRHKCVNYEKHCRVSKRTGRTHCTYGQTCMRNSFAGCAAVRCAAGPCRLIMPAGKRGDSRMPQVSCSPREEPDNRDGADGGFGGRCTKRCPRKEKCVNYERECKRLPGGSCAVDSTCVPQDFQGCATFQCPSDMPVCRLREAVCKKAPCYPFPACDIINTGATPKQIS